MQSICDLTDVKHMPLPLIIFLNSLIKPGNFVPDGFLTEYELNRLSTDSYGAILKTLKEDQVKMIGGMYLIGKVLVGKILFNPVKAGINMQFSESMLMNFKLVSSTLYNSFLEFLDQLTQKSLSKGVKEKPGCDGISAHLFNLK